MNIQKEQSKVTTSDFIYKQWRTRMGLVYMGICVFDFIVAPILWAVISVICKQQLIQWQPLTLQGAGLFHVAMGGIVGVSAFNKSKERIAEMNYRGGVE